MNTLTFCLFLIVSFAYSADYYELLGISKNADNLEIRKAFKKLALKLHPDKTQNKNENTHDQFIAINKAYEALKDENTRKKYDLYGEEGLSEDFGTKWNKNYRSWNYYSESFGIYDDDPEITTLSRNDFAQSVLKSSDIWFVNFYSPQCSHCHHLASDWRKVAMQLKDVIRIGAVNCEEDWVLCNQQNIHSYPSLILYPERKKYQGSRDADSMEDYVMKILPNKVIKLRPEDFVEVVSGNKFIQQWLIFSCFDSKDCLDLNDIKKLSLILDNLVNVAKIEKYDEDMCKKFDCQSTILFYKILNLNGSKEKARILNLADNDFQSLVKAIFELLPSISQISNENLKILLDVKSNNMQFNLAQPSLVQFTKEEIRTTDFDYELKRLKAFLPEVNLGYFNCHLYPETCSLLYIKKFPTYILIKNKGSYEFYHGKITVFDVVQFTKETLKSKVQTLIPDTFPKAIQSGDTWFIDFFAPWCPPCMELLPQIRKISQFFDENVKFGTIDCSTHVDLCRKHNIRSYPTTILYNNTVPHRYKGTFSYHEIEEFMQDVLHPAVLSLSPATFHNLVRSKKPSEIWVINYFLPSCGSCHQLAPHWRKLAKMLQNTSFIKVGEVDCQAYYSLCDEMGINSYPTIHLYPKYKTINERIYTYNGWSRDAASIQSWIYGFLPSKVKSLTASAYKSVLSDHKPWVINFFAPWCNHCHWFAPEFEKVAEALNGKVKTGKINCDQHTDLCRMAGVRSYPTVLFYEGSKAQATQNPVGDEIKHLTFNGVYEFLTDRLTTNEVQEEFPKDEL